MTRARVVVAWVIALAVVAALWLGRPRAPRVELVPADDAIGAVQVAFLIGQTRGYADGVADASAIVQGRYQVTTPQPMPWDLAFRMVHGEQPKKGPAS